MISLPPVGRNVAEWADDMRRALMRQWSQLEFRRSDARATQDGVLLWDAAQRYPVVSLAGEWRQVLLADGYAILNQDANITAAAADTAYKIPFDLIEADGITLTGSPLTDITFEEVGLYLLGFTAQISSTSASQVDFRFWPRINGSDVPGSTIVSSLHNNGATAVATRSAIFSVSAGDVLSAMWAVSSTNGYLHAHAATAFAPAAPSVTLAITRIKA
jgi:hypothetical protein